MYTQSGISNGTLCLLTHWTYRVRSRALRLCLVRMTLTCKNKRYNKRVRIWVSYCDIYIAFIVLFNNNHQHSEHAKGNIGSEYFVRNYFGPHTGIFWKNITFRKYTLIHSQVSAHFGLLEEYIIQINSHGHGMISMTNIIWPTIRCLYTYFVYRTRACEKSYLLHTHPCWPRIVRVTKVLNRRSRIWLGHQPIKLSRSI